MSKRKYVTPSTKQLLLRAGKALSTPGIEASKVFAGGVAYIYRVDEQDLTKFVRTDVLGNSVRGSVVDGRFVPDSPERLVPLTKLAFSIDPRHSDDLDYLLWVLRSAGFEADRIDVYAAWKQVSQCSKSVGWLPAQCFRGDVALSMLKSVLATDDQPQLS